MYPTGAGTPEVRGYRDLNRIGRGGFSFVYRAEQVSLGRSVAIKLLLADLADEDEVRRFTNECVILGRLGAHRHVVDVYDAGVTDDGRPFIVMKFYGRGSLADRLRIGGPLPAKDVVSIGIKLAAALQAAHDIGVVHRDVKPDNVLIDDDGEPVLTDFGVAAIADAAGRYTSSVAFSHSHVAPEVLDRNDFGVSSDIYSLGSTLYTLLTGRAAFAADTEARQILAIMNDPPPPFDEHRVSTDVSAIVMRAMSKRPEDRYATAEGLRFALEELVLPNPSVGDPTPLPPESAVTEASEAPLEDGAEVTRRRSPSDQGFSVDAPLSMSGEAPCPPDAAQAHPPKAQSREAWTPMPSTGARDAVMASSKAAALSVDAPGSGPPPALALGDSTASGARRPNALVWSAMAVLVVITVTASLFWAVKVNQGSSTVETTGADGISAGTAVAPGPSVVVPNVVGSSSEEAVAQIESAGLGASVTTTESSSVASGVVISQWPNGGASLPAGRRVTLTVAETPTAVQSPDSSESVTQPADYGVRVNYDVAGIPDQTFTDGTLDFSFDLCSSDKTLLNAATRRSIKLYRKVDGEWLRQRADVQTLAGGGRCASRDVQVTIPQTASSPSPSATGQGWSDCLEYRLIVPETPNFRRTAVDACVRVRA